MKRSALLSALSLAAALIASGIDNAEAAPPSYTALGLLIDSVANRYTYSYGPEILRHGAGYSVLFCSTPPPGLGLDSIKRSGFEDGKSWSTPVVALTVSAPQAERAACDPSLVRFQAAGDLKPLYYLFYSGAPLNVQTAMFVARSEAIEGPWAKWTGSGWQVDAPDPKPIILPAHPKPEGSGFYGAGQQSVVVRGDRLVSWFTDDTTCPERSCVRIFMSQTRDPTRWSDRIPTNVTGMGSVDVKYDDEAGRYVMYGIVGAHTHDSALVRRVSLDGVTWSEPETIAGPDTFPHWAHNVGIGGDARGHLIGRDTLVAFGAPDPANPACGLCWGHWNLYGGVVSGR